MNGAAPNISTAQSPKPRGSQFARMAAANASLSTRSRRFGKNSITRGSALRVAKTGRSASRHGRSNSRSVVSVGIVGIESFYRHEDFLATKDRKEAKEDTT